MTSRPCGRPSFASTETEAGQSLRRPFLPLYFPRSFILMCVETVVNNTIPIVGAIYERFRALEFCVIRLSSS